MSTTEIVTFKSFLRARFQDKIWDPKKFQNVVDRIYQEGDPGVQGLIMSLFEEAFAEADDTFGGLVGSISRRRG